MARTGYNADIVREQGGSVLAVGDLGEIRLDSGASIVVDSGASVHAFGHAQVESGASLNVNDGASLTIKPTAPGTNAAYVIFNIGANQVWFSTCSTSPTLLASPGDMLFNAQSASTGVWGNTSDGTAGSVWTLIGGTTLDAASAVGP